jgi:hypothetical protein
MIGTLDRLIELGIASMVDAQSTGIQCVPNLLAGGESDAILPRVVVKSESRDDPDFHETPDGIYGVCVCSVTVYSLAEATSPMSSMDMEEMNSAVDDVIDNPLLAELLTAGTLKVYGVVPGEYDQIMNGNQIVRTRMADIWARLQ